MACNVDLYWYIHPTRNTLTIVVGGERQVFVLHSVLSFHCMHTCMYVFLLKKFLSCGVTGDRSYRLLKVF